MFYKPGAAIQKNLAEADGSRDNLPPPADAPEQFGLGVKIEENDRTTVGQSADTDTLVASANAYLNALNKMLIKREKKSLYKNIEHQKVKGGV